MASAANTGRSKPTASHLASSVRYAFSGGGPGPGRWTIASPQASSSPGGDSFVFPARDSPAPGSGQQQIRTTIENIISLYQGAGNALIDLATMAARRMVSGMSYTFSGPPEVPGQAAPPAPPPGGLVCEVISKRPAEGVLDFYVQAPRGFVPAVHALHAGDGKSKSLTKITFVAGGVQQLSVLRIEVPDDQPPGVYTGAIVDATTGEPGGHLILRLS